jgi:hypothetical protein
MEAMEFFTPTEGNLIMCNRCNRCYDKIGAWSV